MEPFDFEKESQKVSETTTKKAILDKRLKINLKEISPIRVSQELPNRVPQNFSKNIFYKRRGANNKLILNENSTHQEENKVVSPQYPINSNFQRDLIYSNKLSHSQSNHEFYLERYVLVSYF